jgi:hypothetical protein
MTNKSKLKELETRIDEVLFYVWDPIGISDTPAARGEYCSYTTTILKCVLDEDIKKIAVHLGEIESSFMGLATNEVKNLEIAKLLLDFKYAVDEELR